MFPKLMVPDLRFHPSLGIPLIITGPMVPFTNLPELPVSIPL